MDIVPMPKRKARILVVEDGITMRMFYRQVLEEAGFEVEEAVNGVEGVERAMAESFDLLVVDVNMPKMDGYEVIRAVRDDAACGVCRSSPSAPKQGTGRPESLERRRQFLSDQTGASQGPGGDGAAADGDVDADDDPARTLHPRGTGTSAKAPPKAC